MGYPVRARPHTHTRRLPPPPLFRAAASFANLARTAPQKDNIDEETRNMVKAAIDACRAAAADPQVTPEDLKARVDELQTASMKIGEAVYKNSSQQQEGGGDGKDGETVDAESSEKK